jgi:hypothetical protein
MSAIPSTFDDITAEWFTGALRERGRLSSGRATAVSVTRFGEGVGLMGQTARLTVQFSDDVRGLPTSYVVKLSATAEANRAMGVHYRIYEKEVRFYRELAPQVPVTTAEAFIAEFDPASHDFVLVLADLAPLRVGSELEAPSDDEVRLAVREMAKLHAHFWNRRQDLPWVPMLNESPWDSHQQFWEQGWPAFLASRSEVPEALRRCGDLMVTKVLPLQNWMCRTPTTIIHMDFRLSNTFFGESDGQPAFALVDWQPFSWARGPYDLGYFMSQSISIEQRRALEEEVLRLYVDELEAHGVTGYALADARADYVGGIAYCLLYAMGTVTIDLGNEHGRRYADAIVTRAAAAAEDLDVFGFLSSLPG